MTMIMASLTSASNAPRRAARNSWVRTLVVSVERWILAYMDWKIERAAIALLRSMTDRQLSDIGISRSEIASAVKRNAARYSTARRQRSTAADQ